MFADTLNITVDQIVNARFPTQRRRIETPVPMREAGVARQDSEAGRGSQSIDNLRCDGVAQRAILFISGNRVEREDGNRQALRWARDGRGHALAQ